MGADQEMRLFNLLYKIIQKLRNPLEPKSEVYWDTGTWTCPEDGFILLKSVCASESKYVLIYIVDQTGTVVASLYGGITGGTYTTMFPVAKGHRYKTSYAKGYLSINAFYVKLGV